MKKTLILMFCCISAFTTIACENEAKVTDELEQAEKIEEIETTPFSQDDFVLRIDTLPYRGAVLFIDYRGEIDISGYDLSVDIMLNDNIVQQDMPGEQVDGNLIAEVIDLMYLPGDELDFILKIKEEDNEVFECYHSEQLQRYPWKDWILAEGEWFSISQYRPNFKYVFPDCPNKLGAHSSWDIGTTAGKAVEVYCGTMGIVYLISAQYEDFVIYNPYVGALVQYGHTVPVEGVYEGKMVMPGEHIANIIPAAKHIHYSIMRPLKYTRIDKHVVERFDYIPESMMGLYWCYLNLLQASVYDSNYYKDPYYWHEPTTLGYWNEETLPPGLKEEMLRLFIKDNPNIVLPAMKPIGSE
jgi:hypothetical protein